MKTICVLASVILALISGAMGAAAQSHGVHGQGHDILHYRNQTLSDKSGRSCCSNQDCRPTQSRVRGERVEVMVDGEWTIVPPEKIINEPSPDLGSHVCSPTEPGVYPKGHIFCVVIGAGV
jgi:hypothetical protein